MAGAWPMWETNGIPGMPIVSICFARKNTLADEQAYLITTMYDVGGISA